MISNKKITIGLVIASALIFVIYFTMLQFSLGSGAKVPELLDNISTAATEGNWQKAEELSNNLKEVWNKNEGIIMINYSEAEFTVFGEIIARLQTAISHKEAYEVAKEAADAARIWDSFGKIVPKP